MWVHPLRIKWQSQSIASFMLAICSFDMFQIKFHFNVFIVAHILVYDGTIDLFVITFAYFTLGFPLLVDDPKALEAPPWVGTIEQTCMLPSKWGIMFGSSPVELANPTFKCLCFLVSHVNTLLEPYWPVIFYHSTPFNHCVVII